MNISDSDKYLYALGIGSKNMRQSLQWISELLKRLTSGLYDSFGVDIMSRRWFYTY